MEDQNCRFSRRRGKKGVPEETSRERRGGPEGTEHY